VLFYRAVRSGNLGAVDRFSIIACLTVLTEPVFLPSIILAGLLVLFWERIAAGGARPQRHRVAGGGAGHHRAWTRPQPIVHGAGAVKNTVWVNILEGNTIFATGTDRLEMTAAQKRKIVTIISLHQQRRGHGGFQGDANRQYDMLSMSERARLRNQPEIVREHVFKDINPELDQDPSAPLPGVVRHQAGQVAMARLGQSQAWNVFYIASRLVLLPLVLFGISSQLGKNGRCSFPDHRGHLPVDPHADNYGGAI